MQVPTRSELEAMLTERIAAEPGFRAQLLADPRGVIGRMLGIQIADSVAVSVHTESLTDVHLTIPRDVDQLSDADLELAAGGADWSGGPVTCSWP